MSELKDYTAAIETGGTKLQLVLGTADGEILYRCRERIRKEKGAEGILTQIGKDFPVLQQEAERRDGRISRIGIGFGGPVDTEAGVPLDAALEGWKDFPLAEYMKRKYGIDTYVYNDSNAAAWGEYRKGTGDGSRVFFYTNMGSGVGGGVVINGKLFDGQGFGAAEIGRTYLYNPDRIDGCRYPVNIIENVCSGWGIQKRLRSDRIPETSVLLSLCGGDQSRITGEMWGEAIRKGDAYSLSVLDEVSEYFALGLCNVLCFFSPEVIAIGGGISLIGEPLISRIRTYVDRYVFANNRGRYRIVKSRLDEDVVLVGTLLLANGQ